MSSEKTYTLELNEEEVRELIKMLGMLEEHCSNPNFPLNQDEFQLLAERKNFICSMIEKIYSSTDMLNKVES